ncbi:MAG: helix-turn-helix domain-containing protein [Acutalibacteraceae bacterium]|nr:helix-turn-helix domain-containing protein [Acutalibacteraceae bacterium]
MAGNKTGCLFYDAAEVFEMMGMKDTMGYNYLDKTMATGKPFAVIRIGKLYRIPKESFDSWIKRINQPVQD